MGQPNKICIHLFSDLFPCPWLDYIPKLEQARKRLQTDIKRLRTAMPEYLLETVELCQGCTHYDPVGVHLGKGRCTINCARMNLFRFFDKL